MAYDGIEVEIKLKADQKTVTPLLKRLLAAGAEEIHQVDAYFDDPTASFVEQDVISEWLSVRVRNSVKLNYKRFHFGDDGIATHSEEVDLTVADGAEASRLLRFLGYEPLITVDKRRTAAVLDGFEVAVDEVVDLGFFVEIEALHPEGSIEQTRSALLNFADALGLPAKAIDHKGYPHLLLEKRALSARSADRPRN